MPDRRVLDHLDVARAAAKTRYSGWIAEELLDAAYEALCRAAAAWDPARCPFRPYAYLRCRQAVANELRHLDLMPRNDRRLRQQYRAAQEDLAGQGVVPTPDRVADTLGVSGRRRAALLYAAGWASGSLDATPSGVPLDVPDVRDVASEAVWAVALEQMRTAAKGLPPRLGYVYRRLYVDGAMVRTVAEELAVSAVYVSQLRRQVEAFLRDAICGENAA